MKKEVFTALRIQHFVLILLLLLILTTSAHAAVRRICAVSYQAEYGWSKEYQMEVTFIKGSELNQNTHSWQYSPYSNYALVWFDKGEVAILELTDFVFGWSEFTNETFRTLYSISDTANFVQVNSAHPRYWKIRARDWMTFIDPRANQ